MMLPHVAASVRVGFTLFNQGGCRASMICDDQAAVSRRRTGQPEPRCLCISGRCRQRVMLSKERPWPQRIKQR